LLLLLFILCSVVVCLLVFSLFNSNGCTFKTGAPFSVYLYLKLVNTSVVTATLYSLLSCYLFIVVFFSTLSACTVKIFYCQHIYRDLILLLSCMARSCLFSWLFFCYGLQLVMRNFYSNWLFLSFYFLLQIGEELLV